MRRVGTCNIREEGDELGGLGQGVNILEGDFFGDCGDGLLLLGAVVRAYTLLWGGFARHSFLGGEITNRRRFEVRKKKVSGSRGLDSVIG
jgi:hypothetical protein